MEGGDTQDQTQEVPVEKRLGPVNVVGWQPNLSQLWEPRIPGLLSWRPSPLSLEFVSLASERQQAIAYVPYIKSSGTYNQNIRHFPGNDEQWSLLIWSQQCAAVQLKRWMSFLWAESQWLSLRLVCILNLPIVIRGSGGELFSLEQEGCHFHFFPSALPPFGKDPHGAGTWIIWFCIRKSTVHPLEDKAFLVCRVHASGQAGSRGAMVALPLPMMGSTVLFTVCTLLWAYSRPPIHPCRSRYFCISVLWGCRKCQEKAPITWW